MRAKTIKKFEKVERLVALGKMSRNAAFKKVGVSWEQWKKWHGGASTKTEASKRRLRKNKEARPVKVLFESGATRGPLASGARYDLVSPFGLERLALIYGEGAGIHGPRNWEEGMPVSDVINRAISHLNLRLKGDRSEDHVAKVAWAMFAIMEYEATHLECFDIPRWHVAPQPGKRRA